jgi:hypothetical protein
MFVRGDVVALITIGTAWQSRESRRVARRIPWRGARATVLRVRVYRATVWTALESESCRALLMALIW